MDLQESTMWTGLVRELTANLDSLARLEAIKKIRALDYSNETIARALLDARDSDSSALVREAADLAVRDRQQQEIIRANIALSVRLSAAGEEPSLVMFEAAELDPTSGSRIRSWEVVLSVEEAKFTSPGAETIVLARKDARTAILPREPGRISGAPTGSVFEIQDRRFAVSRVAHAKLMDWAVSASQQANAKKTKRTLSRRGIIFLGIGLLQLLFPTHLNPFWGFVFTGLGLANLFFSSNGLSLLNSIALLIGGSWYVVFAPPSILTVGILPAVIGLTELIRYYSNRR